MIGHFSEEAEEALLEFKEKMSRKPFIAGPSAGSSSFDESDREAFAIGYPQQSYSDKADMPCNKPKAEAHGDKSHVVKACGNGLPEDGKLIRFGQKGAKTAGAPKEGESERMKAKRASFKARHAKNIAKGPSSAAYWADRTKW